MINESYFNIRFGILFRNSFRQKRNCAVFAHSGYWLISFWFSWAPTVTNTWSWEGSRFPFNISFILNYESHSYLWLALLQFNDGPHRRHGKTYLFLFASFWHVAIVWREQLRLRPARESHTYLHLVKRAKFQNNCVTWKHSLKSTNYRR